jgi:hypothetical protein
MGGRPRFSRGTFPAVHKSLSPEIDKPVEFVYADAPVAVG